MQSQKLENDLCFQGKPFSVMVIQVYAPTSNAEEAEVERFYGGCHHWLDGRESEWTLGVGDGQGGLACCNSWGCKESDMTEQLIWSDLIWWWPTRLLQLTPKKDVLFIIRYWNVKVGSQEIPGVTGKFGLEVQNEAGQRLIAFCQENALVIANTLFQREDSTHELIIKT